MRDCDNCARCGRDGCKSWDCDFVPRKEAIEAWKEKYETADRKTEPNSSEKPNNSTISKMEQVETMSCAECKHRPIGAEICEEPCHYEPQTDWHYDEQDATWYPYKHEDEPQQKSCATCKHALGNWDGESNNCGRCCGADRRFYEPKDEQTEREGK